MEWIEPSSFIFKDTFHPPFKDISIVETESKEPQSISFIAQFFLAPLIYDKNSLLSIPLTNEQIKNISIDDLSPHFRQVKIIKNQEIDWKINLQDLKRESYLMYTQLTRDDLIHPIIKDLFFKTYGFENQNITNPSNFFKIKKNGVKSVPNSQFSKIWEFISKSFFITDDTFVLSPTNWYLSNSLLDSPAIQYFNSTNKNIFIKISSDNNLIQKIIISN